MNISCVLGYFEAVCLNMHAHDYTFSFLKEDTRVHPISLSLTGFFVVFLEVFGASISLQ